MEGVVGFTQRQRLWFLERDGQRCCFHICLSGKWKRCKNQGHLEVHHIIARGWSLFHLSPDFSVNGPMNGITLCREHHCGYQADGDYRLVVHPDVEKARLAYRQDQDSYKKMAEARSILNKQGFVYWNTNFDWMFQRWVKKHIFFVVGHPYPDNKKRTRNGLLR